MTIRELMKTSPATVAPDDSLHVADGIMVLGGVRHLPVLSGSRLVGVLSQRDILRAPLTPASSWFDTDPRFTLRRLTVRDMMTATVVTIGADATVQAAAERLLRHRVGCLPVLEDGMLVGIVTTSDLLRALADPAASTPGVALPKAVARRSEVTNDAS